MNHNLLPDKILCSLEMNLSEEELGAFVDLYSTPISNKKLVEECRQNNIEEMFSDIAAYRRKANQYYGMLTNDTVKQFRDFMFYGALEDFIVMLSKKCDKKDTPNIAEYEKLLEYMMALRVALDVLNIDMNRYESHLYDALMQDNAPKEALDIFFEVVMMYYRYICDYNRLEIIFKKYQALA